MIGEADPLAYVVCLLLGFGGGELKSRLTNPGDGGPPDNCTTIVVDATKPPLRPNLIAIVKREGFEQEVSIVILILTIIASTLIICKRNGSAQAAGRSSKRISVFAGHPISR